MKRPLTELKLSLMALAALLIMTVAATAQPISGATSACVGASVSYSASPSGGTWTSSNTSVATVNSTTGVVTGVSAGTATITYNKPGHDATTVITINPLPAIAPASNSPLCAGSTVSLNVNPSTTGTVCGTASENGTLTLTAPAGCVFTAVTFASYGTPNGSCGAFTIGGCHASNSVSVVSSYLIGQNSASISASNTVFGDPCSGTVKRLYVQATYATAATYSWSGPLSFTSTSAVPTISSVTSAASGIYTVTATTSAGCSATGTTTVTVNPMPTVSAGSGVAICNGSSTGLAASGATTYSWTPATGLSATTGATPSASPSATTTYTVTGAYATGCSTSASVTVTVNPVPVVAPTNNSPVCVGGTVSFNANPGASGTICGTASENGSITLTAPAGCVFTSIDFASYGTPNGSCGAFTIGGCHATNSASIVGSYLLGQNSATINATNGVFGDPCSGTYKRLYIQASYVQTGTTYAWSGPSAFSSTATTPSISSISGTAAGTYSVTATLGSCSATASTIVTVNALPAISAGSGVGICTGNNTTLTATGGTSYTWAPAGSLSASTGASVTASPASTTTYTITGTNGSCSNTANVTVTVSAFPTISAGSNVAICNGASTTLTGTGGTTYTWSPSAGLSATTGSTVIASPSATTTYTLTGTNAAGCSRTATVTVSVNALPAVAGSASLAICNGASTTLSASGAISYSWTPSIGLSATTGASVTAHPSATTIYSVTGTNAAGCTNTTTITVSVNPIPVVSAGAPVAICSGNATTLTATGAATYVWTPATALSASTGASVTASPLATTVYSVTGTSSAGCSNTASVAVTVNAIPVITAGAGATICNGSSAALTASGAATYSWAPATGLSATTGATTAATATSTTTYTVTGTSAAGCSSTATQTISVLASPAISAIGNSGPVCAGNNLSFSVSASGGTGALSYSWSGPNAFVSALQNPVISAATTTASGTYTVTITDANSCTATGVNTTNATVNPLPALSAITGSNGVCIGSTTTLSNTTAGGIWTSASPVATIGSASGVVTGVGLGSSMVTYTYTNTYGCVSAVTKLISVQVVPQYINTYVGNGTATSTGDGGPAYLATIGSPRAMSTDTFGNMYVCDIAKQMIRKIDINGIITSVAGNGTLGNSGDGGPATAAMLNLTGGGGIYVDGAGNIYIACTGSSTIRKINGATGIITTIAGTGVAGYSGDGGPATAAKLNGPLGLCMDASNTLYIADNANYRIRKLNCATGIINTIAGTGSNGYSGDGGQATAANFSYPRDVVLDNSGNLYVADCNNNRIRKYAVATGIITTIAGTGVAGNAGDGGPAIAAKMYQPARIIFDGGSTLYFSDQSNNKIRQVNLASGIIQQAVANGSTGFAGDGGPAVSSSIWSPAGLAFDKRGYLHVADGNNRRIRSTQVTGSIYITAAGATTVTSGTPVTFTAATGITLGNTSIQWQVNGSNVGTGSSTYTYTSPATGDVVRCILTVSPDCGTAFSDTSNSITISVAGSKEAPVTTIVNDVDGKESIKLYPNPAHDHINVEARNLKNGKMQVSLFDQMGRVVFNKQVEVSNNELNEQLEMQSLPSGIYIVSLTDSNGKNMIMKCVKN